MVDLPCLPSQTFWCVAVPHDEANANTPEGFVEEVVLAEKPEYAKRQIEGFWQAEYALILSQEDVRAMMSAVNEASPLDGTERYFVRGEEQDGSAPTVVVSARNKTGAYMEALATPGMTPAFFFSETRLNEMDVLLEKGRTGQSVATQAKAA